MKDFWLSCGHHLLDRDEGGGLLWAGVTARRIAAEQMPRRMASVQAAPVMAFCLLMTAGLMGLLVG